jgi:aminoglycoside phosphotransferase (APT) family kinase protein
MTNRENQKFEQIIQKIDPHSKLLRTWPLTGGVSAQVTAIEIVQADGHTQKMIVRRHGERDLKRNPRLATDEFKLLHLLHSAGLPTPTPYYLDQSGEIFPTPYIVLEYIEGKPEFAPAHLPDLLLQFATHLSRLHQLDISKLDLSFLPRQERIYTQKLSARPAQLDESLDEGRIRAVLEAIWPLPQHNTTVLLHGDFWPGNILWRDGQLVAIIDWEDAALGDPLADLANSRLEILWAFGIDAMHHFTDLYRSIAPIDFTNLPSWDLCAALRPAFQISEWAAGDQQREQTMREGHKWFLSQAFTKLSAQHPTLYPCSRSFCNR